MVKKGLLAVILAVLAAGAASAQVTISGGFALSSVTIDAGSGYSFDGDVGYGGNVYLDYLLPVGVPVSLGGEIGYDTSTLKQESYGIKSEVTVGAIPLLLRVAYHFDLMPKLDLYLVGKIGYVFGTFSGDISDITPKGGIGFGFDVGAAYYFASTFGLFAEGGFDQYALSAEAGTSPYTLTIKAPFSRFFTLGISLKF